MCVCPRPILRSKLNIPSISLSVSFTNSAVTNSAVSPRGLYTHSVNPVFSPSSYDPVHLKEVGGHHMTNHKHGQVHQSRIFDPRWENNNIMHIEFLDIIGSKSNTVAAAKCRKQAGKNIADCGNLQVNGFINITCPSLRHDSYFLYR